MKNKIIICFGIIVLAVSINSCENKEAVLPSNIGPGGGLPAGCDTTHLTYNSGPDSVSGIINTQCAVPTCHVKGGGGTNYTSYYLISASGYATGGKSSQFYTCLVNGNPYKMPNVAQPGWNDACTQAKIIQWILDGAPQ